MLAELAAQFRAHPVATSVELGSVCVCLGLFVGTFALLSSGPPTGTGWPWLLLIGVGAAFVLFWTVAVPLYERLLYRPD